MVAFFVAIFFVAKYLHNRRVCSLECMAVFFDSLIKKAVPRKLCIIFEHNGKYSWVGLRDL